MCGVVWCGVVWCGVVWCGGVCVVWCGVVWCVSGVVWWCGVCVVWCGAVVWCGVCVVWCGAVVWCVCGVVWCGGVERCVCGVVTEACVSFYFGRTSTLWCATFGQTGNRIRYGWWLSRQICCGALRSHLIEFEIFFLWRNQQKKKKNQSKPTFVYG